MAKFKESSGEGAFRFKHDVSIEYRPQAGKFHMYDSKTKETSDIDSVTFASVVNLARWEGESFTSSRFAQLFKDPIVIFDTDPSFKFSKVGTYVKGSKVEGYEEGQTTLCALGVLSDGRTAEIKIKGMAKLNLTKKEDDGSNAGKVLAFDNAEFLTLSPAKTTIVAGSGKKKKDIYLLEVKDEGVIPEELTAATESVYADIQRELKELRANSPVASKDEEADEAQEAKAPKKKDDDIDISDIPFR